MVENDELLARSFNLVLYYGNQAVFTKYAILVDTPDAMKFKNLSGETHDTAEMYDYIEQVLTSVDINLKVDDDDPLSIDHINTALRILTRKLIPQSYWAHPNYDSSLDYFESDDIVELNANFKALVRGIK